MRMLKIVRETVRVKEAPMVVHCSAGCGRTGTLAAIDDVWSQLEVCTFFIYIAPCVPLVILGPFLSGGFSQILVCL